MPEILTFHAPADAPERDLRRLEQDAEVARRNAQIDRRYPNLRDQYGRDAAMEALADRHDVSPRTVRRVVYEE
jgi:transcriptional regulator GlxA family with amidase domain